MVDQLKISDEQVSLTQQPAPMLLWTGGWDSTFRLLQRVLIDKQPIQPIYFVNPDRKSIREELKSMALISQQLFAGYPEARGRLLPLKIINAFCLKPLEKYQRAFENILTKQYLGTQYAWLATYCEKMLLHDVELAIHRDDNAQSGAFQLLQPFVIDPKGDGVYQLSPSCRQSDEYRLFQHFRFPLFNFNKTQMQSIAKEAGFNDLMGLTWFCHTPRRGPQPCGVCNPCKYTIEEGMGHRIPLWGRVRYELHKYNILHWLRA